MSDTPDVLAAIKRLQRAASADRYILHATEEAGLDADAAERQLKQDRKILHALAADIKEYRESPSMANRIALLARCRGEQPTQEEPR